jgi:hydrogenase large subunit
VDIVSALKADPKKTSELAQSISSWPNSSPGYYRDLAARLTKFVESGQLGPFRNAYWGHPDYKLPPEANLMAVGHYLEALDFQKEIVKIQTIFGGKNPHPNWLVGGVPASLNVDGTGAVGAINMERLNMVSKIIDDTIAFIDNVYIPDLLAIAGFYKHWGAIGGGLASTNLLSYGEFPDIANDQSNKSLMMPRGAILGGDLKNIHAVDLKDPAQIQEFVAHSWYKYADETKGLHPFDGVTDPHFVLGPNTKGTKTDIQAIDESAKYSWVKSPRYKGQPVEVGPLARYVIGYASNNPEFKEPLEMVLKKLDVPLAAVFSTLGRTAARGLECSWAAHKMKYFFGKLMANIKAGKLETANVEKWEPSTWPKEAKGAGFCEAPRGALGHWIKIKDGRIENYQCIVPTTWNAGPRDTKNQIGPYEAALMNTAMAKPEHPLEILRTIHSFDPCLACASHVISPSGEEITRVEVR